MTELEDLDEAIRTLEGLVGPKKRRPPPPNRGHLTCIASGALAVRSSNVQPSSRIELTPSTISTLILSALNPIWVVRAKTLVRSRVKSRMLIWI